MIDLLEKTGYRVRGEIYDDTIVLHLDLTGRWSASIYKDMLLTLADLKEELPRHGITMMVALIENDPKLLKFETMLGFKIATQNDEMILMYQECNQK